MRISEITENFADGKKKGKSRPGRVKRSGASCNGSVTDLRKRAKKYSGERGRMYHWCANMKSGRKKSQNITQPNAKSMNHVGPVPTNAMRIGLNTKQNQCGNTDENYRFR